MLFTILPFRVGPDTSHAHPLAPVASAGAIYIHTLQEDQERIDGHMCLSAEEEVAGFETRL